MRNILILLAVLLAPLGAGAWDDDVTVASTSGAYDLEGAALTLNTNDTLQAATAGTLELKLNSTTVALINTVLDVRVPIKDTTARLILGTSAATGHALGTGDTHVTGKFEVDDSAYFDGQMFTANHVEMASHKRFYASTTEGMELILRNSLIGADAGWIGVGAAYQVVIGEMADRNTSLSLSSASDTMLVISSKDASSSKLLRLTYIGASSKAVIDTTGGDLELDPAGSLRSTEEIQVGQNEGTSPTEPATCNSTNVGMFEYVDDTDDSGAGAVCVCIATGDDGAGSPNAWDWRRMDDHGTACPFY